MHTDVCLILEGTYPYVYGGVSSWVNNLITSLPDVSFSIVHLSATGDIIRTPKYKIPSNILEFKEVFVHDFHNEKGKTKGSKGQGWDAIQGLYQQIGNDGTINFQKVYDYVINHKTRRLNTNDMLFSPKSWDMMLKFYNAVAPEVSFVDFYWTMRLIHNPIVNLFNIDMPDSSIYHTICTGYAGILAVLSKLATKRPMVLTEHGIYTHERKIEIASAQWIYSEEQEKAQVTSSLGFFRDLWIKKFEVLSKLTYQYADEIITLFEGNKHMQIEAGAPAEKISIVPNGVVIPDFDRQQELKQKQRFVTVGFAGRIVPIKDVKVLVRAMKIVKDAIPDITVYIMGAWDEDPQYFEECRTLVQMLQLEDQLVFTDNVNVHDYYPLLDVLVLTSVSEAQPLSVLEAMSYGLPVVATNVGSCPELILGRDEADKALGAAGMITNVGSPHETAKAVISILENPEVLKKMSASARQRVEKYYQADVMFDNYRELYNSFAQKKTRRRP